MSRRGHCHDNTVAKNFFQLFKHERIKKNIYGTQKEAHSDIFDHLEMFYNSNHQYGSSDQMSPAEYEHQYYLTARKCLDYPWRFTPESSCY